MVGACSMSHGSSLAFHIWQESTRAGSSWVIGSRVHAQLPLRWAVREILPSLRQRLERGQQHLGVRVADEHDVRDRGVVDLAEGAVGEPGAGDPGEAPRYRVSSRTAAAGAGIMVPASSGLEQGVLRVHRRGAEAVGLVLEHRLRHRLLGGLDRDGRADPDPGAGDEHGRAGRGGDEGGEGPTQGRAPGEPDGVLDPPLGGRGRQDRAREDEHPRLEAHGVAEDDGQDDDRRPVPEVERVGDVTEEAHRAQPHEGSGRQAHPAARRPR